MRRPPPLDRVGITGRVGLRAAQEELLPLSMMRSVKETGVRSGSSSSGRVCDAPCAGLGERISEGSGRVGDGFVFESNAEEECGRVGDVFVFESKSSLNPVSDDNKSDGRPAIIAVMAPNNEGSFQSNDEVLKSPILIGSIGEAELKLNGR